ncbi:MAG: methyltransferase domain-containing protein [Eggerthella lenta]
MDELELRHAEAHYAEMPRDGYSGRCEMLLPEDLRGMRVLDLGCRNGKGACKLADRVGPDGFVLGVDPSAACVARGGDGRGRVRGGRRVVERLAFARGCFEACARRAWRTRRSTS